MFGGRYIFACLRCLPIRGHMVYVEAEWATQSYRYIRRHSGWFHSDIFEDWFTNTSDNLASHISMNVITDWISASKQIIKFYTNCQTVYKKMDNALTIWLTPNFLKEVFQRTVFSTAGKSYARKKKLNVEPGRSIGENVLPKTSKSHEERLTKSTKEKAKAINIQKWRHRTRKRQH